LKDEGTKKLGNEGAYLPPNRYGMTPQKYWDVAEATIKLLASKGVLNPKDQEKVLAAVQHRITPMQELETISSGDLIEKYKDIANQVVEFDGLHTGSPTLDAYLLGVQPKNFMVIGARTGVGKTLVANFMIANFACQKEKILYLALEESEEEVGSRWAKVVLNNHLKVPKDSVHFAYAEMISAIKEDKYNLIPILSVYAQLGFTMVAVDMLNNLIDTVRDEDGNVFLNRLVSAVQNSGMTLVMTTRLRQPITDMEKDFPTMDSVYGRVDLGYVVSKCIALTQLDDVGDGNTYLRVHILKNRRKQIGMPLTYPILKVSNLLEISDTGNDDRAEELRKAYEANGGHKPKPPKAEDADKTTHLAKDADF